MHSPLDFLPHGPEFRFIDTLLELEPGHTARATYRVRGDETFLPGHFPGAPMMPGVLLVEAVAQLAGVVAQSTPGLRPLDDLRLTAIRAAKITGTAVPGEKLEITARVEGRLGPLVQASGTITVHGHTILQTQVTLSGRES